MAKSTDRERPQVKWWSFFSDPAEVRAEKAFYNQMQLRGRVKDWKEIEPHVSIGRGTLLIEQGAETIKYDLPDRIWWTPEDILHLSPVRPPVLDDLDTFGFYHPHPFVEWCFRRYIDPQSGTAVLVHGVKFPKAGLPSGFMDTGGRTAYFRKTFPAASIVDTTFYRFPRCLDCGYDLRASTVTCPECGSPVRTPWRRR